MEKEKTKRIEYVHSMRMAAELMLKGFRIIDIQKNHKNPKFDVYCFHQTPELTQAIFQLIEKRKD